jgi:hypothetical protein
LQAQPPFVKPSELFDFKHPKRDTDQPSRSSWSGYIGQSGWLVHTGMGAKSLISRGF